MGEITIKDIIEFNKKYSFISAIIEFIKDIDANLIFVKDIKSVSMISGFGDANPFHQTLHEENWIEIFGDNWKGDGHYSLDIAYKNILDCDKYQMWYYYEIQDIEWFKYTNEELNYGNDIPFEWGDLE